MLGSSRFPRKLQLIFRFPDTVSGLNSENIQDISFRSSRFNIFGWVGHIMSVQGAGLATYSVQSIQVGGVGHIMSVQDGGLLT